MFSECRLTRREINVPEAFVVQNFGCTVARCHSEAKAHLNNGEIFIMKLINVLLLAMLLSAATLLVAADHGSHGVMKLGKGATISVSDTTSMGGLVLKPGIYSVRYEWDGNQHYMELTRTSAMEPGEPYSQYSAQRVGKVKCELEPAGDRIKDTAVVIDNSNGERRVSKLEVRGENVVHVF